MTLQEIIKYVKPYGLEVVESTEGEGAGFYFFKNETNVFRADFNVSTRRLDSLLAQSGSRKV